jgi:hypothetical protein
MKLPKIVIKPATIESEGQCLAFNAKCLSEGYYRKGDFLILPYRVVFPYYNVYFPDFPYTSNFWSRIKNSSNEDFGYPYHKDVLSELNKYINLPKDSDLKTEKNITQWKIYEERFLVGLTKIFSQKTILSKITSIEITVTRFGTPSSYYLYNQKGKHKIICSHRLDYHPAFIAKTILLALYTLSIRENSEIGEIHWFEKQAFVDFTLNNTILKDIFPPDIFKSKNSTPNLENYIKDSYNFLNKLGFIGQKAITLKDGLIYISNVDTDHLFTPCEKLLLQELLTKQGRIVSFESAAKVVWADKLDERFSLYALAKIVENLRKKLYSAGINNNILKTVRKKGYLLLS